VYDFITKFYRHQAEVVKNHENPNVCDIGRNEAGQRKCRGLKLDGGEAYDRSSDEVTVVA
jgi:hypothetical protein